MDDKDGKKALLGELAISDDQRAMPSGSGRWIVTGIGAVALGVLAWLYLLPESPVFAVKTGRAIAAAGPLGSAAEVSAVLDATGYVTARRQATVSSKLTGKVREVFIEEGMVVKEGELLATLDDSTQRANFDLAAAQFDAAQARLAEVRVRLQEAELDHARTIELERKDLASAAGLDRARLAVEGLKARLEGLEKEMTVAEKATRVQRQQLDDMQIKAPFAGVVIAKAAQPGEMISPVSAGGGFTRTGICTIVDMDSLEIEVDVNEAYINRVTPGQKVDAMLNSYPDWRIPAEVITIIPTADRSKATVRVRIRFLVRDSRILPDMGVRVAFLEAPSPQGAADERELTGVLVPARSVVLRDGRNIVFVVAGEGDGKGGKIAAREVRLGPAVGNRRNVASGLVAGDEVVVSVVDGAMDELGDGAKVTIQ